MKLYFTCGINNSVANDEKFAKEIMEIVDRYCRNDWGELCDYDIKANEDAINYGGRIFAAYLTGKGKVYIITDDISKNETATTILFASEY